MRLIDADKLLDDMKKELEKAVNDENLDKDEYMVILTSAIALKDFVNRQPTAFDVDKVVEQLESLEPFHVDGYGDVMVNCDDVIELVKEGGIVVES